MTNPCPHCGRPNREGARFCTECGAALSMQQAGPPAVLPDAVPVLVVADAADGVDTADASAAAGAPAAQAGADDPLPPDPQPEPDADPEAGAWIASRFYVRDAPGAPDALGRRVYEVEDHGACPLCGAPLPVQQADPPAEAEPYCTECGAHLLAPTLRWPLRRLVERTPPTAAAIAAPDGEPDSVLGDAAGGDLDSGLDSERQWTAAGRTFALLDEPQAPGTRGDEIPNPAPDTAGEPKGVATGLCLLAGQRSDVGIERAGRANEDSLFALTLTPPSATSLGLYIVADGMGGHQDGEVASRTACTVISTAIGAELPAGMRPAEGDLAAAAKPATADLMSVLDHAVREANRRIYQAARAAGSNMGSTVVAAVIAGGQVFVANVGDSRAYLWRGVELRQLTADHSHVFTLVQKGLIDEDAIYTHPRRNEIYRSLGAGPAVEVDCFQTALRPGDLLLLCSDGLWEMLRSEGIADVLLLNLGDPQVICDELVRRANLAGGEDNISVIAVRATGTPSEPRP